MVSKPPPDLSRLGFGPEQPAGKRPLSSPGTRRAGRWRTQRGSRPVPSWRALDQWPGRGAPPSHRDWLNLAGCAARFLSGLRRGGSPTPAPTPGRGPTKPGIPPGSSSASERERQPRTCSPPVPSWRSAGGQKTPRRPVLDPPRKRPSRLGSRPALPCFARRAPRKEEEGRPWKR